MTIQKIKSILIYAIMAMALTAGFAKFVGATENNNELGNCQSTQTNNLS